MQHYSRWAPEALDLAERVPVWTRPERPSFTTAASGNPARFSAWVEPSAPAAPIILPAEPAHDIDAIQTEAYTQGFDAGYTAAAESFAAERAALVRLAEGLEAFRPEPAPDLGRLIAEAVKRLVGQIVGEVAVDPAITEARARAVADLLADEIGTARVRVHPADLERLAEAELGLQLCPDPTLAEGTLIAETQGGWIEDGPAMRLDRLRAALDAAGCR